MTLRDYQKQISGEAAEKLKQFGCCYLSMQCRTGKSITALETARKFGARSVLFVTKLKAMRSVANDYVLMSADGKPFDLEIINYESAHKKKSCPDFVILDEAHCLGAYPKPSKRTIEVKKICDGLPVLFLSGTPTPESYSQLFHQMWVCSNSPFREYKNFYKWAKDFVNVQKKYVNGFTLNDYSNADKRLIDEATRHLFISYSQEEAGFTCDITEEDIVCPTASIIPNIMRQLKRDKVVHLSEDKTILGDTPATLMTKLHQLSGGTVITAEGQHLILDRTKAQYLRDYFQGKKLAVFYCYQMELDLLKAVFPDNTDSPEEFQQSDTKTFISQVRRAREGVRLDTADAILFYNLEYSYLSYEQGKNRIVSKERTSPANVYFAVSEYGIERDILEAVRGKKDFTMSYYMKECRQKLQKCLSSAF